MKHHQNQKQLIHYFDKEVAHVDVRMNQTKIIFVFSIIFILWITSSRRSRII